MYFKNMLSNIINTFNIYLLISLEKNLWFCFWINYLYKVTLHFGRFHAFGCYITNSSLFAEPLKTKLFVRIWLLPRICGALFTVRLEIIIFCFASRKTLIWTSGVWLARLAEGAYARAYSILMYVYLIKARYIAVQVALNYPLGNACLYWQPGRHRHVTSVYIVSPNLELVGKV